MCDSLIEVEKARPFLYEGMHVVSIFSALLCELLLHFLHKKYYCTPSVRDLDKETHVVDIIFLPISVVYFVSHQWYNSAVTVQIIVGKIKVELQNSGLLK